MSSDFNQNGIINYTGSIPGATQGVIANRPVVGYVTGDWYLSLDEKKLYEWNGSAWVLALDGSGGGGGGGTLQTVTTAGNTTTNHIKLLQGATTVIDLDPSLSLINVGNVTGVHTQQNANSISFIQAGSGNILTMNAAAISGGSKTVTWRNLSGTPALLSDVATPDLLAVTTVGNVTPMDIIVQDTSASAHNTTLHADGLQCTAMVNFPGTVMAGLIADLRTGGTFRIDYLNAASGGTASIIFANDTPIGRNSTYDFRDTGNGETVSFLSDQQSGFFTQSGFTGTNITIPHALGSIPTFASVVATDAATGLALAPGYYITKGTVSIGVVLHTAVVAAITVSINFFVTKN